MEMDNGVMTQEPRKAPKQRMVTVPYIVGISGGSAAGKSLLAQQLATALPTFEPAIIGVDRYYYHRGELSADQRRTLDLDHPNAIDFDRLSRDLWLQKQSRPIAPPLYDHATMTTRPGPVTFHPTPLSIVEGIMLFWPDFVQPLLDYKIYIDIDADTRLGRLLARDTVERGWSEEEIRQRFFATVEPGYTAYTSSTYQTADMVIDGNAVDDGQINKIAAIIAENIYNSR
jgi:uridine kinase